MPKGGIIFCTEIARAAMVYIICPWHSWIARETPTLEAAGSNPVGQAKKSKSFDLDFFICAARHNIICVAHATSFDHKVNIIAARGTNERGCASHK